MSWVCLDRFSPSTALAFVVCSFFILDTSDAKSQRSSTAVSTFKRHNPCPANDLRAGKCPGYVIDHIMPLCAGGPDTPANMQWQTLAESKIKDRDEHRECRALRRPVGEVVHQE